MDTVQITFSGNDINAVAQQAASFAVSIAGAQGLATTPAPKKTKKAAPVAEDLALDEVLETTEAIEDDFLADEVEEKPAPKKAKEVKLTDKDVNAACMAHAKVNGRPKTMDILTKKFKVKSILELKPDQYQAVVTALKV